MKDRLLQEIKKHLWLEELNDILKLKYLNQLRNDRGLPSLDKDCTTERYYYYSISS